MRLLIITELQVNDLIETLKSDQIRPRDLLRALSNLQTLPEMPKPEKPTNVTMKKDT